MKARCWHRHRKTGKPQCQHPPCQEWSPGARYLSKDCQTVWGFTRQDDESRAFSVGDGGTVGHAGSNCAKMTVLTCLTQILWLQLAARWWHVCRACELDITGFSIQPGICYVCGRTPRVRSSASPPMEEPHNSWQRTMWETVCLLHPPVSARGWWHRLSFFFIRKSQALRTRGRKGEKTFDLFNQFINDGRIDSSPLPICQGMAWIQELYIDFIQPLIRLWWVGLQNTVLIQKINTGIYYSWVNKFFMESPAES